MKAASLYLLVVLGSSTARPNNGPSLLPHGMLPSALSGDSERVHYAVLEDSTEEEQACKDRLVHIRSLMAAGKLKEAVDVSLALEAHHRASKKQADCHADKPHVGEGSIVTRVATPDDREQHTSRPVIDSFIKLHMEEEEEEGGAVEKFLRVAHTSRASVRKSMARVPVVGFALDNTFVLAEAPLRCTTASGGPSSSALSCSGGGDLHEHLVSDEKEARALLLLSSELTAAGKRRRHEKEKKESESRRLMAEWADMGQPLIPDASVVAAYVAARETHTTEIGRPTRASSLSDEYNSYAVGTKTTLVIPMVPTDGVTTDDQAGFNFPRGYDYGLVKSAHSSNIRSYLQECMTQNSDFYKDNSWGAMDLNITITPVLQVSYTGATCGNPDHLTYQNTPDPTALDMMGYAAASAAGFDQTTYDLNVLFMPKCNSQPFSGIGWVGVPGSLINSRLTNYDAAVAHELGHNLGARHASYMTTGSRGADAFGAISDLNDRSDWVEYGNPHSTMGQGVFVGGPGKADFMIEGKAVFDWVSDAEMVNVIPDGAGGVCQACGLYYLFPTDAATKPASGATLGITIATATANRYYFIEHRIASTSGNAALITWADINSYDGETGVYGNSVLVDCTPGTSSWLDAGCAPGMSIQLSTGSDMSDAQQITVSILQVESDGTLAVEVAPSSPTVAPTSSPAPTKSFAPTPVPTTTYPCLTMTLAGPYSGPNSGLLGDFTVAGEDTNGNMYFTNGPYYMYFYGPAYWLISGTLGSSSINWYTDGWTSEWPGSIGWTTWTGAAWDTPAGITLMCAQTLVLPTPAPTTSPVSEPTSKPTFAPTVSPVPEPTSKPIPAPTTSPVPEPTSKPTLAPTTSPVPEPTSNPTAAPNTSPVLEPTNKPTVAPTVNPVPEPTSKPTLAPAVNPVPAPTKAPTKQLTLDSGACFHGNGTVLLQSGLPKRLSELGIGDIIKTGDAQGRLTFSAVVKLPHANNDEPAAFITLQTETGKKVDITSDHYIPRCDLTIVTAGELVVGDCLFTADGKETLVEISSTEKNGVYTVVTEDKFIVVNGVVASPFSKESHPEEPELDYEKYRLELGRVNSRKLAYLSRKATKLMAKKNFKSQLRGG